MSALMAPAMATQMTPTVAAAANELPVSMDMAAHSRNDAMTKVLGFTICTDQQVMAGMVPDARQLAVRAPMSTNIPSTGMAVRGPCSTMRAISRMP